MAHDEGSMFSPPLSPSGVPESFPFAGKDGKEINFSTLSRAKLDMAFIRIMSEQKTPLAQIQSLLKMSPAEKISIIQLYTQDHLGGAGEGEDGTTNMQRTPSMPDLEVLNDTFVDLLVSMGISSEYQQMYMKLPASKKWTLISQNKNSMQRIESQGKPNSPQETPSASYFVKLFELEMITNDKLAHLYTSLSSENVEWTKDFIAQKGIPLLCTFTNDKIKDKTPEQIAKIDHELLTKIVDIFKQLSTINEGIEAIVKSKIVPSTIIMLFTSPDIALKTKVLELFIVICAFSHKQYEFQYVFGHFYVKLPSNGYSQVISAFKLLKDAISEEQRFETLVHSLSFSDATPSYLENAMKLINKLVSTPEDAASRIRIRDEFIQLGILKITVAKSFPPAVLSEFDSFQRMKTADEQTSNPQTDKPIPLNETDPSKIFHFLQNTTTNTPYYAHFLHTLQNLLELTADVDYGPRIWESVDSLTFQYKQMINRQEVEEDAVILSPRSSESYSNNIKNKYTNHIDHMGKLLLTNVQQVVLLESQLTQSQKEQETLTTRLRKEEENKTALTQQLEQAKKESDRLNAKLIDTLNELQAEKSTKHSGDDILIKLAQEKELLAKQLREMQEQMNQDSEKARAQETNYGILKHKFVFIPLALVFCVYMFGNKVGLC
eukprot:Phypoly_transcript_03947.p1 GENE.Phypoly_transcript_03947~~Phypoly_transcript_03947.p1  ORF type:complete len:662 (+),score=118.88 Phypoly_transcript_03947:162-2147(+)